MTGQDILFCGVASAMMSGVMTATSALGSAATKLMPERVSRRARWLTSTLDKLPLVGNGASHVRAAVGKLAPPEIQQRPWLARCSEVDNVTADTKALRSVDDSGAPWDYKPGQFVTLELNIDGKKVFRSYTMSSTPTEKAYFEVTVKRVDGGLASNWLCDNVGIGTTLNMTGPHGKFSCAPKPRRKLLMLSAGSGVTPMLSMSRWLRDQDSDGIVVYFHCARTEADLMFAGEVAEMAQSNPRFVQHISLTRSAKPANRRRKGSKASTTVQWAGLSGYLDAAMLRTVASDYQEREIYVCGPTGFMEGTKALIEAAGFDMRHHHEESFGTSNKETASGGVLWLSKSGIKVACSGEQSILDIAQQAGVTIPSACRTGDCGECKVRLISGDALMANTDGLDAHELEAGAVLSCVAFVNGEVAIDA